VIILTDASYRCWQTQKARHVILGHSDSVLALAVSEDYLFSGSQDGTLRVWNIESLTLDRLVIPGIVAGR